MMSGVKQKLENKWNDSAFQNELKGLVSKLKGLISGLFRIAIIVGVTYVILGPIIGMISRSFWSDSDYYSPMVYLIPTEPTFQKYQTVIERLNYWSTVGKTMLYSLSLMVIQVVVCSMVGYGFARFQFPFKKLLFACVVIMIVIPTHTIMLPLYVTFSKVDLFGLITAINGKPLNLLSSTAPMYILTIFGCGLRSGLYIYIFNQFFRGLPKEIEEAAFVDGAGTWYTYFRIMLINALPSVVTVAIFSLVWQYNDTFYAKLFVISDKTVICKRIASLQDTLGNVDKILDPAIQQLYVYAGVVLIMLPVVIIYCVLQKFFIEGVERSGIVG